MQFHTLIPDGISVISFWKSIVFIDICCLQRLPLPHIIASRPSALNIRILSLPYQTPINIRSVTSNPCMKFTPFDCFFLGRPYGIFGGIYIYVIITYSMHFSLEPNNLIYHFDSYLLLVISLCFITPQRYYILIYFIAMQYLISIYLLHT